MSKPLQLAVVATVFYPYSHADVIVSRWLSPWPDDARAGWVAQTQIAGMFVAQTPPRDLRDDPALLQWVEARERPFHVVRDVDMAGYTSEKYGIPLFPSIREALCLGGRELAVDGVLLIGEHGAYPFNEWGQKMYPRKEMWDEIVAVFRGSGRVVPVFNDKGLSWNPDWVRDMFDTARALNIPFMAGSSLTLNGFASERFGVEPQEGDAIEESVSLFGAGPESYGFHSVEWMQSLLERLPHPPPAPIGVDAVEVWEGAAVWDALDNDTLPRELWELAAAQLGLSTEKIRASCETANEGATSAHPEEGWFRAPIAFRLHHQNGTISNHFYLAGPGIRFVMAMRTCAPEGAPHLFAARNFADEPEDVILGHFARLNTHIQKLMLTGQSPVPPERTLIASLAIAAVMKARAA